VNAPVISYAPFEELIASLRADGLGAEAERRHNLIHKVAWTSGSELIGELGQEMKRLEREHGSRLSTSTAKKIEVAFDMVRRIWPDFPR
jgi:hypothetical protein